MAQLPTSSLIVLLDIERYGERPDGIATDLRESMYRIADEALTEAGIVREHRHVEDRGDGLLILLPQAGPIEVLGAFVRELESLVRHRAASRTPAYRMRLRIAIANGFVRHDGNGWIGSAINKAARLVDSAPVRAALTDNPGAHVAIIVTEELYQDVVAQDHPGIDAGRYREAQVQVKELDGRAWVCVPYTGEEPAPGPATPGTPGAPAPGGSFIGNQVNHGDQHIHGDFTGMTVQLPGSWS